MLNLHEASEGRKKSGVNVTHALKARASRLKKSHNPSGTKTSSASLERNNGSGRLRKPSRHFGGNSSLSLLVAAVGGAASVATSLSEFMPSLPLSTVIIALAALSGGAIGYILTNEIPSEDE